MTVAILDIKHWGNNLGVRLPAAVAKAARLQANQRIRLQVKNGSVIITPLPVGPMTLEQRLALFDAAKHGGEVMQPTTREGAERW
jgi:antitoxin MazE